MNKGKQATLFQTWDHCLRKNNDKSEINTAFINSECYKTISLLDDDEDDEELSLALEHSLANHIETSESSDTTNNFGVVSFGYVEKYHSAATDASDFLSQWKPSDGPHGDVFGFDRSAGQLWVYPINFPLRDYQLSIVRQALLKNTLVILPTGLGKTFIAAVVMYNFYRWYPEGKIIFMAPTKPLVAQQIDACYNMMGIPEADTMEMTGSINPIERRSAWLQRRVFFLTPQVIANDLIRGSFQAQTIKCLVFDEAHKAMGNYAYCQVVREVLKCTKNFRVLALSATPGNDLKCVQQILNNLCISHIELRSEDSPDIKPYIHERVVEKIVLPLGDDLCQLKAKYCRILSKVVKRLVRQHVLYHRDPSSLSKFLILNARESFRQRPPASLPRNQYSSVECDFGMALTLYHGYELLQLHGAKSFFNFLHGVINGDKMNGRTRAEVLRNDDFKEIMSMLQEQFQFGTSCLPSTMSAILSGHPKFEKLEEVILKHFKHQMTGLDSRAMVFTQYRDTVDEITNLLHGHQPLIKVKSFVGHSSSGRSSKGFTHKDQLEAMQEFRSGKYNVLVSTCVGEEGLDIGHVDLIVCFDAHNSPVRLIQRMGRTGRSRRGRVVMLMMEGKEEQMYKQSQYSRSCVHNAIIYKGAKSLMYYRDNPRMVPADITPVCHRIHIAVPEKRQQKRTCVRRTKREGVKGIGKRARSSSITSDKDEDVTSDSQVISYDQYCQLRSSGYRHHQRTLPTPIMHCLQPHENKVDCGGMGSSAVQLDLSEWLPWQNMLQQTSLFGHGKRSVNLVDLLEFTDLQQMRTSHEDSYGREMALHLNMADVSVTAQPCSDRLQCPPCLTPCCSNTSTAGNAIALVESENVHLGNVPGTSRCRVSGTEDIRHVDLPTDIIIPNNNNIDSAVEMSHDHQQRAEGCSCKVIDGRMHDGDHFSPGISICNECCSAPVITADYLVNSSLYHQPNGSPPVSRKALRSLLLDVRRDDWLNVRSCHVIKRNAQRRFVPPLSFLSPPSSDHLEVLSKFVNCMNSSNSKVTDLLQLSTEQSSHRCPKDVENMFTLSDVQVSCGPRLQTHVAGEMSNLSRASPGNSLVECTHDSSAMDLFLSDFSPAAGDIYKYDKCPAIDQSLDKQVNHFSEPHDRFGHAASTCQDKYLSSKSSQQAGTCQDKNLSSKSYQPAGTCQGKNQFSRTSQPAGTCQYKNLSSKSALPAGTCQDKNLSSKSYQPASTCQDKDLSSKSSTSTIVPLCGNALTVHHFGEMGSKYNPLSAYDSDTVTAHTCMTTCGSNTVTGHTYMTTCGSHTVTGHTYMTTCFSNTVIGRCHISTCGSNCDISHTSMTTCSSNTLIGYSPITTVCSNTVTGHSSITTRDSYTLNRHSQITARVSDDVLCSPVSTCVSDTVVLCRPVSTCVSDTVVLCRPVSTCVSDTAVLCSPVFTCVSDTVVLCTPVSTCASDNVVLCSPVSTCSVDTLVGHSLMTTRYPYIVHQTSLIATCVNCTPIIHGSMNTCCPVATTSRQSFIAVSCTPIIHGSTDTCCPVATTSRQSFIAVSCTSNIFKDHVYRSSPNFNLGFDFDEDIIPPSPLIAACQTHYMGHSCSSPSTSVGNSKADVEMSAVVCECAVQSLLFPDAMAIMKDEELIEQDHLQTYMRGVTRETRRTAVGGLGGKSVCVDQQGQEVPHNGLPSMKRSSSSMCCQMLSVNPGSFDAVITGRSMCSLTSCTFYNNSSIGNGDRFVKSSGIPQLTLSSIGNNDCFADVPSFNLNPDFQDDDNDNFFPSNDFLSDNIEDTYVLNQTSVSSNSLTPLCVPDHCGSNSANPLQGQQSHHGLSLLCDTVSHVAVITSCDICVSTMQEDNIGMLSGDCHSSRARSDDVIMSVHHNSDVCTVNTMPSPISSCLGGQSHWSVGIKGSLIGVSDDFKANEHDDFLDRYVLKKKLRKNQVVASKKTHNYNFLDDEAQQSNDVLVSSDETDDDSMVLDDYNFVNNAEVSLAAHADMQAVYMKSVKSPVDVPGREGQGRYRLQFNLADVTDVISQSSDNDRSHDESHYMIDSFCVSTDHDSGRDESVKEGDDDHSDEVGDDDHSAEEDDKDNITAASARKGKQRQSKSTLMTGRMRIMRCSGSSSNDSMDGLPPTQICQSNGNGWVTFASSSDESFAL